ncbi:MAG: ferredoxin [Mycobacterium sp.]|nr:ferredoxin [Mycobacterium sp.]MCW2745358.1 ferredoxin [Mycobacterium sp.]
MTVSVSVDREKCCGYGICAEICPQIYKLDDQGFVYLEGSDVPAELAESAAEGADACPESAIALLRN